MVTATPQQIKDLSHRVEGFVSSYSPEDHQALIYVDEEGRFGFGPGPKAPAGCESVVTRARVAYLMSLHGFVLADLREENRSAKLAELVYAHGRES